MLLSTAVLRNGIKSLYTAFSLFLERRLCEFHPSQKHTFHIISHFRGFRVRCAVVTDCRNSQYTELWGQGGPLVWWTQDVLYKSAKGFQSWNGSLQRHPPTNTHTHTDRQTSRHLVSLLFRRVHIPAQSVLTFRNLASYTGCFMTLGHNCRRRFPRFFWSKIHINMCPILDGYGVMVVF